MNWPDFLLGVVVGMAIVVALAAFAARAVGLELIRAIVDWPG